MLDSQFNWLPYVTSQGDSADIKAESSDPNVSLLSPPSTPSHPPLSVTSSLSSTPRRRSSTSSLAGPRRQRPYPSTSRDSTNLLNRKGEIMSSTNAYGTWSGMRSGSGRSHPPVERRSSDGDEQTAFALNPYMNDAYMTTMTDAPSDMRPASSSSSLTSSLTGAMGETNISAHSRQSRSPPSTSGSMYGGHVSNHDLSWNAPQMPTGVTIAMSNATYPGVAGHSNIAFHNMGSTSVNGLSFNDYSTTRNASPESISPPSPPFPQAFNDQFVLPRNQMAHSRTTAYTGLSISPPYPQPADITMSVDSGNESELRRLRRRVRDLEIECNRSRSALEALRGSMTNPAGLPTPPHSSSFQAGWKARTDARKKLFCSLNRAGNALCAWHDSRRERRAFPPRNAPAGYLNCGCTYEEALFEESLARHGVGSYHPGETVRMDPALRNPLLKLLETRYGYKDGDFEHDPLTEEWAEGEAPPNWEQKVHSGQVVRRRPDADRH